MRPKAILKAIIAIALVSSNASAVAILGQSLEPLLAAVLASVVSSLILIRFRHFFIANIKKILRSKGFILACFCRAITDICFFLAMGLEASVDTTVLVYLYPMINILFSAYVLDSTYDRLEPRDWLLVATAFASILVITPLSELSQINWIVATLALMAALASIYHVVIQKVADDFACDGISEKSLLFGLLSVSSIIQILFLSALFINGFDFNLPSSASQFGLAVGAIIWIAIFVNWLFESLWLSAVREFRGISLKSVFFLSPVLGSLYLAALGFDDLNPATVFALTGVVVSNFLLHNRYIGEISFFSLIFCIIGFSVVRSFTQDNTFIQFFSAPKIIYDVHIAVVTVLVGFILLRAFEVHANSIRFFSYFADSLIDECTTCHDRLARIEEVLLAVIDEPDVAIWNNSDERRMLELSFNNPQCRSAYLDFLRVRIASVSPTESFLCFLICFSIIPYLLYEGSVQDRLGFLSIFVSSLFVFLPLFIMELVTMRQFKSNAGLLIRRMMFSRFYYNCPQHLWPNNRTKGLHMLSFVAMGIVLLFVVVASWRYLGFSSV